MVELTDGDKAVIGRIVGRYHVDEGAADVARKVARRFKVPKDIKALIFSEAMRQHLENIRFFREMRF